MAGTNDQTIEPFGFGSRSISLYAHDLPPTQALDELFEQARLAWRAGFDGVTLAEHHNGYSSYLPTPLQVCGWLLEEFPDGWSGAYPLLVPLRPIELWIEELAWLVARFPGRVGLGTAPGYVEDDFTATASSYDGRFRRYWASVATLMATLDGRPPAALARDPAVVALRDAPIRVVAAAVGRQSIAHAARLGLGIAPPGHDEECTRVFAEYRSLGGRGPRNINRWPWIGRPPGREATAEPAHLARAGDRSWLAADVRTILDAPTPELVAERLNASIAACSATSVSIRLHHGAAAPPEVVRHMIEAFGDVLPRLEFPPAEDATNAGRAG